MAKLKSIEKKMDCLSFTVKGKPVPKVRMTQKDFWKPKAQECLKYQELVAYSFLQATTPKERKAFFVGQKYFKIDLLIYLKAEVRKDYICGICGREWSITNIKRLVVKCPNCGNTYSRVYDLPKVRGDKDNYEKSIVDGIQYAVKDIFNDKQILTGTPEIIATHRVERVEIIITPYVLKIEA